MSTQLFTLSYASDPQGVPCSLPSSRALGLGFLAPVTSEGSEVQSREGTSEPGAVYGRACTQPLSLLPVFLTCGWLSPASPTCELLEGTTCFSSLLKYAVQEGARLYCQELDLGSNVSSTEY